MKWKVLSWLIVIGVTIAIGVSVGRSRNREMYGSSSTAREPRTSNDSDRRQRIVDRMSKSLADQNAEQRVSLGIDDTILLIRGPYCTNQLLDKIIEGNGSDFRNAGFTRIQCMDSEASRDL